MSTALTPPMVEIDGVSKRFGDTAAVIDASLSLARGAFLTIVGPSGCGKTTLLRMIAGFERPTAGQITINGASMSAVPAPKRAIGMVFQRLALFPHMTAAQNIAYPLRRRGHPKDGVAVRVKDMLDLVRLDGLGGRRPHELSGGQQQRVAIARALAFGPDLLLLDEPLSALDKKLREDMQLEFRRIQQDLGVTTINVTHDQREALVMSDRIVVMNEGRIEQESTPQAVYHAPETRFVASFLGMTSMVPGTVERAERPYLIVKAGDACFKARGESPVSQTVDCAMRAETIAVRRADAAAGPEPLEASNGGDGANRFPGTVSQVVFEGDRTALVIDVPSLGDATISAFSNDPSLSIGAAVLVSLDADTVFAFPETHKEEQP